MTRLLALNSLFFLLPFILYGGWLLATRGTLNNRSDWPGRVILGLVAVGAVVMTIGLVVLTSFSGAGVDTQYRPAVVRDGQLVPGEFVPRQ